MRELASNTLQHLIKHALFLPVRLADGGQAGEDLLARDHGLAEDHEEPAYDREVAEEEVEVEDEAVAEALNNNDAKETGNRVLRVPLGDDRARTDKHDLARR